MYINEVKRDKETLKKISEFQSSIENLVSELTTRRVETIVTVSPSVDIDIISKHYFHNLDLNKCKGDCTLPVGAVKAGAAMPRAACRERGAASGAESDLDLPGYAPCPVRVPCAQRWPRAEGQGPRGRTLVLPPPPCLAWTRTLLGPREGCGFQGGCGFSCSRPPGHPLLRSLGGTVERVWSPCPGAALDSPLHLGLSRVTPHGTRSPGLSEAQPWALGEALCPVGRVAGWCSPRRVRERRLRAVCGMFSRGFSISALLTPRDGRLWWGHLFWASQDGGLHPWSLSTRYR